MKKIILFMLIFSPTVVFANVDSEKYLIEKADGSVAILNYISGSNDSLDKVIHEVFPNQAEIVSISKVKDSDFPKGREDRNFWKKNDSPLGPKVVVDTGKKASFLQGKMREQNERKQVLTKLNITEPELELILKKAE